MLISSSVTTPGAPFAARPAATKPEEVLDSFIKSRESTSRGRYLHPFAVGQVAVFGALPAVGAMLHHGVVVDYGERQELRLGLKPLGMAINLAGTLSLLGAAFTSNSITATVGLGLLATSGMIAAFQASHLVS